MKHMWNTWVCLLLWHILLKHFMFTITTCRFIAVLSALSLPFYFYLPHFFPGLSLPGFSCCACRIHAPMYSVSPCSIPHFIAKLFAYPKHWTPKAVLTLSLHSVVHQTPKHHILLHWISWVTGRQSWAGKYLHLHLHYLWQMFISRVTCRSAFRICPQLLGYPR